MLCQRLPTRTSTIEAEETKAELALLDLDYEKLPRLALNPPQRPSGLGRHYEPPPF